MKKSKRFLIVFIIISLFSTIVGYILLKVSYMNHMEQYLDDYTANNLWENDLSTGVLGTVFSYSIVIGLIAGGISTLLKSKNGPKKHIETKNAVKQVSQGTKELTERPSISQDEFVMKLKKTYKLYVTEMYSSEEYFMKKRKIILELKMKKINTSPEEFLNSLIPLKDDSILSLDEILEIKKIIV